VLKFAKSSTVRKFDKDKAGGVREYIDYDDDSDSSCDILPQYKL